MLNGKDTPSKIILGRQQKTLRTSRIWLRSTKVCFPSRRQKKIDLRIRPVLFTKRKKGKINSRFLPRRRVMMWEEKKERKREGAKEIKH